jgi:putative transposase
VIVDRRLDRHVNKEATSMNDRQREVALFRYSLIQEAADPALSHAERGELVRELAGRDHAGPGGRRVRVARNTLDRWIRTYRAGGFEALAPSVRHCEPVTPAAQLELAERRLSTSLRQVCWGISESWGPPRWAC